MTVNPKLSIIVPVYNGEKHIKKTVRNLLSSSYQNLELLLIDDGSADASLALCKKLAESDFRIKVFHKENGGIGDARNFGLAQATGDYIGFCDQDDEVSEYMFQKMLSRIVSDGSQAAICGCYRQKRNGERLSLNSTRITCLKGSSSRKSCFSSFFCMLKKYPRCQTFCISGIPTQGRNALQQLDNLTALLHQEGRRRISMRISSRPFSPAYLCVQ